MKRRPIIGVTTSRRGNTLMWIFIWLALTWQGAKPRRITSLKDFDFSRYDGFVIGGGTDINPELYRHKNIASFNLDYHRDELEYKIVKQAISVQVPLLGICRGAQMINIVLGGTLTQNARAFFEGFLPTTSIFGKIFARRLVLMKEEGILSNIFRQKTFFVNSLHHQAHDVLGKGLRAVAQDECGLIQAIEGTRQEPLIIGVQWHPEYMIYRKKQRKIFKKLVDAAKQSEN